MTIQTIEQEQGPFEEKRLLKRYLGWMFNFLALYVIGYAITPYKEHFAGLLLGGIFSLFLLILTYRRVKTFTHAIASKERPRPLGTLIRYALAVLAVAIALEYPQYFHWVTVVVGLLTAYIIIFIDILIQVFKSRSNAKER